MTEYDIALYPGDGIGPEVTRQAVKAIDAASPHFGFTCRFTEYNWGCAYYRKEGKVVPDDYMDILAQYDAILMGALGDPAQAPDHLTVTPIIEIRQRFDQYVGYRPAESAARRPPPSV